MGGAGRASRHCGRFRSSGRDALQKAAEQGLPRAQCRLAQLYAEEPSTTDSDVNACAWFTLAAASLITPSQIAEAMHRARLWRAWA
jgi:TPR repeat protein